VLVRRLLAVAAEKTGQRLQSESARGRKRLLALGDDCRVLFPRSWSRARRSSGGNGNGVVRCTPVGTGKWERLPALPRVLRLSGNFSEGYRGFSDSEELLRLCFCSS